MSSLAEEFYRPEEPNRLSEFSTKELVDELSKRDGVNNYPVELEWIYTLHVMGKGHDIFTMNDGKKAVRILVVDE